MDAETSARQPDPGDHGTQRIARGAVVRHVTGRGSDGRNGMPPVASMVLGHPDGLELILGLEESEKAKNVRVHAFGVPEIRNFGVCPICGSEEDLTREHVPQRDLGGTVMTRTCKRCNNGLGSRIENELRHWFDGAIFDVNSGVGPFLVRDGRRACCCVEAIPGNW